MTFLLSCLFYSLIGSLTGFFSHIFNGLIQANIRFNLQFVIKTLFNFVKVIMIMALATLMTAMIILLIPKSFLEIIGTDKDFFYQLVYYLFAFAAFDFGLKN